jgi:antitoxin component HigA of HigAB toxin-antitoxin module
MRRQNRIIFSASSSSSSEPRRLPFASVSNRQKPLEGRFMIASKLKFSEMPIDYSGLVAMYPPRTLHDRVDERNVEEIVMEMAGHELSGEQEDYLELLSDLLLKYRAHKPLPKRAFSSPRARLKYLMEQSQMTPMKLAKLLGCSQPLVSLLLSGKRQVSKENVKKLAIHFRLDATYFL